MCSRPLRDRMHFRTTRLHHAAQQRGCVAVRGTGATADEDRSDRDSRFGLGRCCRPYVNAVRAGLRDLGYIEGKNLIIEYRFGDGNYERLPNLAAQLVHLNVDVLVMFAAPGTQAAKSATSTIPIVMAVTADAVGTGLIATLAHPCGNVTGTTVLNPQLMAKRLELLKEIVPVMTHAAVLLNPGNAANGPVRQAVGMTAKALQVGLQPFDFVFQANSFDGGKTAPT